ADQALGEELGDGEVEAVSVLPLAGGELGDPGAGEVLGVGLGDVGPGGDLLVVHHLGQGRDVILVEGTQHQPLRADGDVGEGARHAPLRSLRVRRVLLNCPACSMKALNRTAGPTPCGGVDPVGGHRVPGTQNAATTDPAYFFSMNFFTSGEVSSFASFLTRGSFSSPFFTARKLP